MAPKLVGRIQHNLCIAYAHLQMFLYQPFLHYASDLQSNNINTKPYACAAACVDVSRNIVHVTGDMKRRGLLISWFYMYTTFFAIMTLIFFVLENPSSSTSADILRDAYEGKDTLASLAKRSMAADRCTITLAVRLRSVGVVLDCSLAEQSLFEQLPGRLDEAGILSILPNRRKTHLNDFRKLPSSSPIAAEDSSRPTHGARPGVHAQAPILGQNLESNLEYDSSASHRVMTYDYEIPSHVTDDYLHMPLHDFLEPADAMISPTPLRAHMRGSSDATQSSMAASPTFGGMSFAGGSANMFYPADSMPYPEPLMGSVGCENPIKLEDDPDPGWYGRFSNVPDSSAPHVQVFGECPPYPLPGRHPDVPADARCMHTWADLNDRKNRDQTAAPMDGADGGWSSQHARPEMFLGMNSRNPATTEWMIHHGY